MTILEADAVWRMVAMHLWQCSLVVVAMFLLAALLRRAPAHWLHVLWVAALAKLLLPLPILGAGSLAFLNRFMPGGVPTASAEPTALFTMPAFLVWEVVRPGTQGTFWISSTTFVALYLAGVCGILIFWLHAALRNRKRTRSYSAPTPEQLASGLADAIASAGVPGDRILLSPERESPAVIGLLRPRIVLPREVIADLEPEELRAILLHEDAHRRRRDPLFGLLQRAAILGFYYYPLLWPVLRRLSSATEMACDDVVLAHGVPRDTYVRALAKTVHLCVGPAHALAAAGRSKSILGRRFDRIARHGQYVRRPRHVAVTLVACLLVAGASFAPISLQAAGDGGDLQFAELNQLRHRNEGVQLNHEAQELTTVLWALGGQVGLTVKFAGEIPTSRFAFVERDLPLRVALQRIAADSGIEYRVPNPDMLLVVAPAAEKSGVHIPGVDGVTMPARISDSYVAPVYPAAAREEKLEGRVILQATIGEDGMVRGFEVLHSSTPDHGFEEAAMDSAKQWRYEPASLDDEPVAVYLTIRVDFRLE